MEAFTEELENGSKKMRLNYDRSIKVVNEMLEAVESCKREIERGKGQGKRKAVVAELGKRFDEVNALHVIKGNNKAIHATLGKIGKSTDRLLTGEQVEIMRRAAKGDAMKENKISELLTEAVIFHLLFEGYYDIARELAEEAGRSFSSDVAALYKEIRHILKRFETDSDVGVFLEWAEKYSEQLKQIYSRFIFEVHRVRFLQLVDKGETANAVEYARSHFKRFSTKYAKEIQILMGSLVFLEPGTATVEESRLKALFKAEACCIYGLPSEAPLQTVLECGELAISKLSKYYSVCRRRNSSITSNTSTASELRTTSSDGNIGGSPNAAARDTNTTLTESWTDLPQFPVEVPLPDKMSFHSIVICPVSKAPITDENYSVLLQCGHIIGNESIQRLPKSGGRLTFKCPTCQTEQNSYHTRRVHFGASTDPSGALEETSESRIYGGGPRFMTKESS